MHIAFDISPSPGGGGGVEIMQLALSYYLNKLRKDCFLKHHGRSSLLAVLGLSRFNLHFGTHLSLETFINLLFTKRSFSVQRWKLESATWTRVALKSHK